MDTSGFSLVHWAAKKGDIETLSILHENGANLNIPTSFDAKMLPIHWAASDGKIASIRFNCVITGVHHYILNKRRWIKI